MLHARSRLGRRRAFVKGLTAPNRRGRRDHCRPVLEQLEDRRLLALFQVNSLQDAIDANRGDGVCATATGQCTLRAAIQEANATVAADIIDLPAGTYPLSVANVGPGGEDQAATGDLDLRSQVTIRGAGADVTIVDGGRIDRVFHAVFDVFKIVDVTISGLTIQNGLASGGGANDHGGGLLVDQIANVTLVDSTVHNNTAHADGGGLHVDFGFLRVSGSTLHGNQAHARGGGIFNGGAAQFYNSTVSSNTSGQPGSAASGGGGAYVDIFGDLFLDHVTMASNRDLGNHGDGILNRNSFATRHSMYDNSLGGGNYVGEGAAIVTSFGGHNLDRDGTMGLNRTGDVSGTLSQPLSLLLGPLQDNGGTTLTHLPAANSPAVDAIVPAQCFDSLTFTPLLTDQRGVSRPQGSACDIGAVEFDASAGGPFDAEAVRQALNDGLTGASGVQSLLPDWGTFFDLGAWTPNAAFSLPDFDLVALTDALDTLFHLGGAAGVLSTANLPVFSNPANGLGDLVTAMDAVPNVAIDCVAEGAGGYTDCAQDTDALQARYVTTLGALLPTDNSADFYASAGIMPGLAELVQINSQFAWLADLRLSIVFGFDQTGFYVLNDSALTLDAALDATVVGNGNLAGTADVAGGGPVAITGAISTFDLDVAVTLGDPDLSDVGHRYRLDVLNGNPAGYLVPTADGQVALSLGALLLGITVDWDGTYSFVTQPDNSVATDHTASLVVDIALPGFTANGAPRSLALAGVFANGGFDVSFAANANTEYALAGFVVAGLVAGATVTPNSFDGNFAGEVTVNFGEGGTPRVLTLNEPFDLRQLEVHASQAAGDRTIGSPAIFGVENSTVALDLAARFDIASISGGLGFAAPRAELFPRSGSTDGVSAEALGLVGIIDLTDGVTVVQATSVAVVIGELLQLAAGNVAFNLDPANAIIATLHDSVVTFPSLPNFPTGSIDVISIERNRIALEGVAITFDTGPTSGVVPGPPAPPATPVCANPSATASDLRRPVLVLPGIGASYAADLTNDTPFLMNRGTHPCDLQLDPLANTYAELVQTLVNVGYQKGVNLFEAPFDWRMMPTPQDGAIDGHVTGITADSITDETFEYGVDYVGFFLRKAAERWATDHPGVPLESVDVITHSTGGLVARGYVQSDAYGLPFQSATHGTLTLPKINNLIMIGVPNRGASKAWNILHNNWAADATTRLVFSKIANRAYQKVLAGETITGPDPITRASILNASGQPNQEMFIERYIPTLRALLATYDFLKVEGLAEPINVNNSPPLRNSLLLDLNNGLDLTREVGDKAANDFAEKAQVSVLYGTTVLSQTLVAEHVGENLLQSLSVFDEIVELTDFQARDPGPTETWYEEIRLGRHGDGTVPLESSVFQFIGDDRVALYPFQQNGAGGNGNTIYDVGHSALPENFDVQKQILEILGYTGMDAQIAQDLVGQNLEAVFDIADWDAALGGLLFPTVTVELDPVNAVVIDANGNRLGFQNGERRHQIPGSVYFGGADGVGYILGPFAGPLQFEVQGMGQPWTFQVSGTGGGLNGGITLAGGAGDTQLHTGQVPLTQNYNGLGIPGLLEVSGLEITANLVVNIGANSIDVTGELGIHADEAAVLPDYSTPEIDGVVDVQDFNGTLDLATGLLDLSAGTATFKVRDVITATATGDVNGPGLHLTYDPSNDDPAAVLATLRNLDVHIAALPGLPTDRIQVTELTIRRNGFHLDATIGGPSLDVTLGANPALLEIQDLLVDLDIHGTLVPGAGVVLTGSQGEPSSIDVIATSASLFPGQGLFSSTITGFGAHIANLADPLDTLHLEAATLDVHVGDLLTFSATDVAFDLNAAAGQPIATVAHGDLAASIPGLDDLLGDINVTGSDIAILRDRIDFGSLQFSVAGPIDLGLVTIQAPTPADPALTLQTTNLSIDFTGAVPTLGGAVVVTVGRAELLNNVALLTGITPGDPALTGTLQPNGTARWQFGRLDAMVDGIIDIDATGGELNLGAAAASQPLLTVGQATVTFPLLGDGVELSATDLEIARNGAFSFLCATLKPGTLLDTIGLGNFLPFDITSITVGDCSQSQRVSLDAFDVTVIGTFDLTTLFTGELANPVLEIGGVELTSGSSSTLEFQVNQGAVSATLNGPVNLGFTGLDFAPVTIDAVLTLGEFVNGQFDFDPVCLNLGVDIQGAVLSDATFNACGQLTPVGNNTRLDLDVQLGFDFDTPPSSFARLSVDDFSASLSLEIEVSDTFALVSPIHLDLHQVSVGTLDVAFGPAGNELLKLHSEAVTIDLGSSPADRFLSIGSIEGQMPALPAAFDVGITANNFGIGSDLSFIPSGPIGPNGEPGEPFSVIFDPLPSPQALGLPDGFPFAVSALGLEFGPEILSGTSLDDLVFIVSGGLTKSATFPVEATVGGLKVNVGKIAAGLALEAIEGLDSFSVGVAPIEIGPLKVGGTLRLGIIRYDGADTDADPAHPDEDKASLYVDVEGYFEMAGIGAGARLFLTQYGPVVAEVHAPLAVPLGPTGLLLSGVSGGFRFGGPEFEPPVDPVTQESNPLLLLSAKTTFNPLHVTPEQVQTEMKKLLHDNDVLMQQQLAPKLTLSLPFTLALSGTVTTVATPGILEGTLNLAVQINLNESPPKVVFLGSGNVQMMGMPVGEQDADASVAGVGAQLDFSDSLAPIFNFAFAAPMPGSPLALLFPAQGTFTLHLDTEGMIEAPLLGMKTFVNQLASDAQDVVLPGISATLETDHSRPLAIFLLDVDGDGQVQKLLNPLLDVDGDGNRTRAENCAATPVEDCQNLNDVAFVSQRMRDLLPDSLAGIIPDPVTGLPLFDVNQTAKLAQAFLAEVVQHVAHLDTQQERADFLAALGNTLKSAVVTALGQAWANFNPRLEITGELQPTILGIPFGEPDLQLELIIDKRGLGFGLETSLKKMSDRLATFVGPPGPATALANLLSLGLSDRISLDVKLPLGNFLADIIDGVVPGFPTVSHDSPNWLIGIGGSIRFLDHFELANLRGFLFAPGATNSAGEVVNAEVAQHTYIVGDNTNLEPFDVEQDDADRRIPLRSQTEFDNISRNGGLLVNMQLLAPRMLIDPVGLIQSIEEPPPNFLEWGDYIADVAHTLTDDTPLAQMQLYVPSFARVLNFDFSSGTTNVTNTPLESELAAIASTAYLSGFLDAKLLSVPLVRGTVDVNAQGVNVSTTVPWLAGLVAEFELRKTDVNFSRLLEDFVDSLGFGDFNFVGADIRVPLLDDEGIPLLDANGDPLKVPELIVPIPTARASVTLDSDNIRQMLSDTFGLPGDLFGVDNGVNASVAVYSPAFGDPTDSSVPLVQRNGGIEVGFNMNIEGLVEDAGFEFEAPLISGTLAPSFAASAHVHQLAIPGLSGSPNILRVQPTESGGPGMSLDIQSDSSGLDLSLQGNLTLLDSLTLTANAALVVDTNDDDGTPIGIFGDMLLTGGGNLAQGFFEINGEIHVQLNSTDDSRTITVGQGSNAQTITVPPGARLRVNAQGDPDSPASLTAFSFLSLQALIDLTVSGTELRLEASGQLAVTDAFDIIPFPLGNDDTSEVILAATIDHASLVIERGQVKEASFLGSIDTPLGAIVVSADLDRFGCLRTNVPFLEEIPLADQACDTHVFVEDQSFGEGDDRRTRKVRISLSEPAERDVKVIYRITTGSATLNNDFSGVALDTDLQLDILECDEDGKFDITLIGDPDIEPDKDFDVAVAAGTHYVPHDDLDLLLPSLVADTDPGRITIQNDDVPLPVTINVNVRNAARLRTKRTAGETLLIGSMIENTSLLEVSAAGLRSGDQVEITYQFDALPASMTTANAGDFFLKAGFLEPLTIRLTEESPLATIELLLDHDYEKDEIFGVAFVLTQVAAQASDTTLLVDRARLTILNDDPERPVDAFLFYNFETPSFSEDAPEAFQFTQNVTFQTQPFGADPYHVTPFTHSDEAADPPHPLDFDVGVFKHQPGMPESDTSLAAFSKLWLPDPQTPGGKYYETTITLPSSYNTDRLPGDPRVTGITLSVCAIDFWDLAPDGGVTDWELRSSLDEFATVLATGPTHSGEFGHIKRVPIEKLWRVESFETPLTLRLYGLATEDAPWRVDNVALIGSVGGATLCNQPPSAPNFVAETNANQPLSVDLADISTDPEEGPLTVVPGSVTVVDGLVVVGTIATFTPPADFVGSVSFDFTIMDDQGATADGSVTINVTPGNQAPVASDGAVTTAEDTPVTIDLGAFVNDVETNDANLSYTAGTPTGGTLTGSGRIRTYTPPPNANGNALGSFTFQARDESRSSNTATITINVTAVNDLPVAGDDVFIRNSSVVSTSGNVLPNDRDVDGDKLTTVLAIAPRFGVVILAGDGAFTYSVNTTVPENINRDDAFQYTLRDGQGGVDTGLVQIRVNRMPVAIDTASPVCVRPNQRTIINLGDFVSDDETPDNLLSFTIVSQPTAGGGSLAPADDNLSGTGQSWVYTAPSSAVNTSFTWRAPDQRGLASRTATVSITVSASCVQPRPTGGGPRGGAKTGNGYVTDATAFFDGNRNGLLDFLDGNQNGSQESGEPSEPSTTTAADGSFILLAPEEFDTNGNQTIDPEEGRLVLRGGAVTSTNLPLQVTLMAPAGSAVVTPLTTLVELLMERDGHQVAQAELLVRQAFGLPDVTLTQFDYIAQTEACHPAGPAVAAASIKLIDTIHQVAAIFGSAAGQPISEVAGAVFGIMAERIATGAAPFDTSDASVVQALVQAAADQFAVVLDNATANAAVHVIAAGNQQIDQIPDQGSLRFLEELYRIERVEQGQVTDEIAQVVQGQITADELVDRHTGQALEDQFRLAELGNIIPPDLSIDDVAQFEGNGETVDFVFTVSLSAASRVPVSVRFQTADDTAQAAHNDYQPLAETLHFDVGELTKTITVHTAGDTTLAESKTFVANLSAPSGAILADAQGFGTITNDDLPPTIDSFTSSSPDCGGAAAGGRVTVRARVTNATPQVLRDAIIDWGDGTSSPVETNGIDIVTASHVYAAGGVYKATLSLADESLILASSTTTSFITGVGVHDGVLYVVGTNGRDNVTIHRSGKHGLKTTADFLPKPRFQTFPLADVNQIIAYLCGGDDRMKIVRQVDQVAIVHAGAGNDQVTAGGGPSVLLGDAGNDRLGGDAARNVLVGGHGRDRLNGAGKDDIVIGGFTIYDAPSADHDAAILEILTEWRQTTATSERRARLLAGTFSSNAVKLKPGETVFNDTHADTLFGGQGVDWYLQSKGEKNDRRSPEPLELF